MKDRIWDEEQKKAGELAGCRVNLQAVKNWIALRDKELDSMEPIGNDLQTLTRQKEDMKVHRIIRFLKTAHLPPPPPSPKPTLTLTSFILRAKCWLRGGVGGQFPRNVICVPYENPN